jgi:hypothetical protein
MQILVNRTKSGQAYFRSFKVTSRLTSARNSWGDLVGEW